MWRASWLASGLLPLLALCASLWSGLDDCGPGCAGGILPSALFLGLLYLFFVALCPLLAFELWRRNYLSAITFTASGLLLVLSVPVVSFSAVGAGGLLFTTEAFFGFAAIGGCSLAIFIAWWLLTFGPHNIAVNRDAPQAARPLP